MLKNIIIGIALLLFATLSATIVTDYNLIVPQKPSINHICGNHRLWEFKNGKNI